MNHAPVYASKAERLQAIRLAKMVTVPIDPQQAVEVSNSLQDAWRFVTIDGSKKDITVIGKEHTRLRVTWLCPHLRRLKVQGVRAIIEDGYLSSGDPRSSRPFDEIIFCQRCDYVFHAAPASGGRW